MNIFTKYYANHFCQYNGVACVKMRPKTYHYLGKVSKCVSYSGLEVSFLLRALLSNGYTNVVDGQYLWFFARVNNPSNWDGLPFKGYLEQSFLVKDNNASLMRMR